MPDHRSLLRFRRRRRLLAALGVGAAAPGTLARAVPAQSPAARVVPGRRLRFPEDHGSHPDFRVEWWYATGLLHSSAGELGFQITFFRARAERDTGNPSAFAARQAIIGHAALSDPREGRLLHQQRAARAGFGLADASPGRTAVWIDRWRMELADGRYRVHLPVDGFGFDLQLTPTQPPLLNGEQGYSRKGPRPESASYYYSLPQLAVRGTVQRASRDVPVTGRAWLDHEWSSSVLDERAQGWDWIGINLDDGGALMAFRLRAPDASTFWAGATLRTAGGAVRVFQPGEISFVPVRHWQSARTGARYPVAWEVTLAGTVYTVMPVMDDQEQDARVSTGTVYWEGAVRLLADGRRIGSGYLELTGYWRRLKV